MKCPSEMQKSSTLGSQGITVAVAVSILGIGREVDVEVCIAVAVKVAGGVLDSIWEIELSGVEHDTRINNIWSLASLLANIHEQALTAQSLYLEYTLRMDDTYKTYPHNPPHYFVPNAMYIVTRSLLYRKRLLIDDQHKSLVLEILLERALYWGWELEAWAVLENHYHFIARAPQNPLSLAKLIRQLNSKTTVLFTRWIKRQGGSFGTTIGIPALHMRHLIMQGYTTSILIQ